MFVSHYSDPALTTFGIDLRKFDETNPDKESKPVPPVVGVLLDAIGRKGEGVEDAGALSCLKLSENAFFPAACPD